MEKPTRNNSKMVAKLDLQNALTKKMRLRVWGYTDREYLYMLLDSGLTLKYKTYSINSQDNELEE